MSKHTIEVVYVKGNPFPYKILKPIALLNGHVVNAVCMTKGNQVLVNINPNEIVKRESIPIESWM